MRPVPAGAAAGWRSPPVPRGPAAPAPAPWRAARRRGPGAGMRCRPRAGTRRRGPFRCPVRGPHHRRMGRRPLGGRTRPAHRTGHGRRDVRGRSMGRQAALFFLPAAGREGLLVLGDRPTAPRRIDRSPRPAPSGCGSAPDGSLRSPWRTAPDALWCGAGSRSARTIRHSTAPAHRPPAAPSPLDSNNRMEHRCRDAVDSPGLPTQAHSPHACRVIGRCRAFRCTPGPLRVTGSRDGPALQALTRTTRSTRSED